MSTIKALLHPFTTGMLKPPAQALMLRAHADAALDADWGQNLLCVTGFKPDHDALLASGFRVEAALPAEAGPFDAALCPLTKHKADSLAAIAQAWAALPVGGLLLCAGDNDTGAASLQKDVAKALGPLETASKFHARIFWTRKQEGEMPALLKGWLAGGATRLVPETGFHAGPGMHGWNKIDRGSKLLADHLPGDVRGRVADLGAGWGYLSAMLLKTGRHLKGLDLFEADAAALEAAKLNIQPLAGETPIRFHWADATKGLPRQRYHSVIMNPPFHSGKATDIELGTAFIQQAAHCLEKGGLMLMVANRQLPYEAAIDTHFKERRLVAEADGFKLIEARA